MSYTYMGVQAEVEYRRGRLMDGARSARRARWLRRRHESGPSAGTREQVRDGTASRGYDLAA